MGIQSKATLLFLMTLALLAPCWSSPAVALDLPLCSGYHPEYQRWGLPQLSDSQTEVHCAPGMAYLSLPLGASELRDPKNLPPNGSCCPLPEGALLNDHLFVETHCPTGFVVTGGREILASSKATRRPNPHKRYELRCTRMNDARFTLHPIEKAIQLDTIADLGLVIGGGARPVTHRSRLPVELRFGIGRAANVRWEAACIGYPWGALVVGVDTDCNASSFRELRSKEGERMESRCNGVQNIYSPDSHCIPNPAATEHR